MLIRLAVDFGPCTIDEDLVGLQGLVTCLGRPRVIEVGSWLGRTALAMVEAGAEFVHCVDTWDGTNDPEDETFAHGAKHGHAALLNAFRVNVAAHLGQTIYHYIGTSSYWADRWTVPADLVFIDAEHSYEAALADITLWTPHVRPGGILCGHDFCEAWPGVKRAVEETGPFNIVGNSVWWRQL